MDLYDVPSRELPRSGELRYGFKVAGLQLVPAARVLTEMVADAHVFPVPKSSSALAGVTNVRGTIVPLLDRRQVRRAAANIRPFQHRVLIFDRDEQRVGLLLDEQPQLLTLAPAQLDVQRPTSVLSQFLNRAWVQVDQPDQVWWEFNHRAAFQALADQAHHATNEEVIA